LYWKKACRRHDVITRRFSCQREGENGCLPNKETKPRQGKHQNTQGHFSGRKKKERKGRPEGTGERESTTKTYGTQKTYRDVTKELKRSRGNPQGEEGRGSWAGQLLLNGAEQGSNQGCLDPGRRAKRILPLQGMGNPIGQRVCLNRPGLVKSTREARRIGRRGKRTQGREKTGLRGFSWGKTSECKKKNGPKTTKGIHADGR